jgi:hypothetical protein
VRTSFWICVVLGGRNEGRKESQGIGVLEITKKVDNCC